MDFKKGELPYSEKVYNDFKDRARNILLTTAMDSNEMVKDSRYGNYAERFIRQNFVDKMEVDKLLGIVKKMIVMDIESVTGIRKFPVLGEYKGHYLTKIYYFKIENGDISHGEIDVVSKIINIT